MPVINDHQSTVTVFPHCQCLGHLTARYQRNQLLESKSIDVKSAAVDIVSGTSRERTFESDTDVQVVLIVFMAASEKVIINLTH